MRKRNLRIGDRGKQKTKTLCPLCGQRVIKETKRLPELIQRILKQYSNNRK